VFQASISHYLYWAVVYHGMQQLTQCHTHLNRAANIKTCLTTTYGHSTANASVDSDSGGDGSITQ
jgi:hypothetical protein